jgi:hypothetical protein
MAGKGGTVPIVGNGVFPGIEDGLGGDEGEERSGGWEEGKKGMEGKALVGEEGVADVVVFEVSAEILVFEEDKGKKGKRIKLCGYEEEEPGKEG